MNIISAVYGALQYRKAEDSGVIIFWSGLFVLMAWLIFIIYPLKKLNHSRKIFKPSILPFITTAYAALTYSIIVGGLFRSFELVLMFLPLALLTGNVFGVHIRCLSDGIDW